MHLVHHADVAQAIELALDDRAGGIYSVADDETPTLRQIRRLPGEQPVAPDGTPQAPRTDWTGVMDTARIRTELGFRPFFGSLRAAIARSAQ